MDQVIQSGKAFYWCTSEWSAVQIQKAYQVADDIGISMPHLALAWCLKNKDVITGASKPGQVKENMKAIDKVDLLTDDVIDKIEEILDNKPDQPQDFRTDS